MLRAVDLANLRKMLLTMTELEAAAMALLENLERSRDDMSRVIKEKEVDR